MLTVLDCANQVLDRCDSTNDLARALGEAGAAHGTWVSARQQKRGRGRLGREWRSEEGNLFLSLVIRIEDKSLWSWVPMTIALGTASALRDWDRALRLDLKWPNDLWIAGAKTGGILCEGVGSRTDSFIVGGVGLNCAQSPKGLDQETTSLSEAKGSRVVADDVRMIVHRGILAALERLRREGAMFPRAEYDAFAALRPGTEIQWSGGRAEDPKHHGTVLGLGPSGELQVQEAAGGKTLSLYAEDVKVRRAAQGSS